MASSRRRAHRRCRRQHCGPCALPRSPATYQPVRRGTTAARTRRVARPLRPTVPRDRARPNQHSVGHPCLGAQLAISVNNWAVSEFPKWRKYLILLSFLDNSSARPVQIGGIDVNICHSRVDRSPRTPAVQFAIPPRGDHFVAHGRALWKLTGRGRTERAHRALENAVRFPRASTGPFPSSHPRKTPKGP